MRFHHNPKQNSSQFQNAIYLHAFSEKTPDPQSSTQNKPSHDISSILIQLRYRKHFQKKFREPRIWATTKTKTKHVTRFLERFHRRLLFADPCRSFFHTRIVIRRSIDRVDQSVRVTPFDIRNEIPNTGGEEFKKCRERRRLPMQIRAWRRMPIRLLRFGFRRFSICFSRKRMRGDNEII